MRKIVDDDPWLGHWTVSRDGSRLVAENAGVAVPDPVWLHRLIWSAQGNQALRRSVPLPRPARGELDPLVVELKEIRLAAGVSPRAIRDVMRVRVDQYERGECNPPVGTVRAWAYLLGRDLRLVSR